MQKFTPLSRKTLLNYASGWKFITAIRTYPIVVYINLHNINNHVLHEIKHYMSTMDGCAQVLNTNQLIYLFGKNLKFKFLTTGNIVALFFNEWQNVWVFNKNYQQLNLLVCTISICGQFLNLSSNLNCLSFLENLYQQNYSLMVNINMGLTSVNNGICSQLTQPNIVMSNAISTFLYQLAQIVSSLSFTLNQNKLI